MVQSKYMTKAEPKRNRELELIKEFIKDECVKIGENDENFINGNDQEKILDLYDIYNRWRTLKLISFSRDERNLLEKDVKSGLFARLLLRADYKSTKYRWGSVKQDLISKIAYKAKSTSLPKETKGSEIFNLLTTNQKLEIENKYKLSVPIFCTLKATECFKKILLSNGKVDYIQSRETSFGNYYCYRKEQILNPLIENVNRLVSNYKGQSNDYLLITDRYDKVYSRETIGTFAKYGFEILYRLPVNANDPNFLEIETYCEKIQIMWYKIKQEYNRFMSGFKSTPSKTKSRKRTISQKDDSESEDSEKEEGEKEESEKEEGEKEIEKEESEKESEKEEIEENEKIDVEIEEIKLDRIIPKLNFYEKYLENKYIPISRKDKFEDICTYLEEIDEKKLNKLDSENVKEWKKYGQTYFKKFESFVLLPNINVYQDCIKNGGSKEDYEDFKEFYEMAVDEEFKVAMKNNEIEQKNIETWKRNGEDYKGKFLFESN